MTSISIGPCLRWKLKNLGFEYDPVEDTWFWGSIAVTSYIQENTDPFFV